MSDKEITIAADLSNRPVSFREVVLHERTTSVSIDQVLGCTPTVCCLDVLSAC